MPGKKLPILEVEDLVITNDGRGLIFHDDGTNAHRGSWGGPSIKYSGTADGWIKSAIVSGNKYGPTGAAVYIPFYLTRP